MEILTLYTNGCPKCKVIESKLRAKNIKFIKNDNVEELIYHGIQSLPVLKVEEKFLSFVDANTWVNNAPSQSEDSEQEEK